MIDPPTADWYATSYKETNVGNERDIDSSLLWKAWTQVNSAVRSLRTEGYKTLLSNTAYGLSDDIEGGKDPIDWVRTQVRLFGYTVVNYHPIIVSDARLWALTEPGTLEETSWFRLLLLRARGTALGWVDVVNRDGVATYVKTLSHYYRTTFRRQGARLSNER